MGKERTRPQTVAGFLSLSLFEFRLNCGHCARYFELEWRCEIAPFIPAGMRSEGGRSRASFRFGHWCTTKERIVGGCSSWNSEKCLLSQKQQRQETVIPVHYLQRLPSCTSLGSFSLLTLSHVINAYIQQLEVHKGHRFTFPNRRILTKLISFW